MTLNEFERDQKGSGSRGTKLLARERGPESSRQVGPASLGEAGRPTPVAILRDLFTQVQARYVLLQGSCLGDFAKISGHPARFSLRIRLNFSEMLSSPSSFGIAAQ